MIRGNERQTTMGTRFRRTESPVGNEDDQH
jgi:hypothetical protein